MFVTEDLFRRNTKAVLPRNKRRKKRREKEIRDSFPC